MIIRGETRLEISLYSPNNLFAISPLFCWRFWIEPFIVKERVIIRAEPILRERAREVVGYMKKIYRSFSIVRKFFLLVIEQSDLNAYFDLIDHVVYFEHYHLKIH